MDTATLLQRRALKSFGATPAPVPRRGEDAIDESSSKQIADIIDAMLPPLCVSVSEERAVERERERCAASRSVRCWRRAARGASVCAQRTFARAPTASHPAFALHRVCLPRCQLHTLTPTPPLLLTLPHPSQHRGKQWRDVCAIHVDAEADARGLHGAATQPGAEV